jgi:uncharacterized membrane protein
MMVWMLHGQLTGTTQSAWAVLVFLGIHAVIISIALVGATFAARLSPRLNSLISRLHRPSFTHVGAMAAGLVASALIIHLSLHGIS